MKALSRALTAFAMMALLSVGAGCGEADPMYILPDSGITKKDTRPAPDLDPSKHYKLTIIGGDHLTLQPGQQVVLKVRYTKNEESYSNQTVTFGFRLDAQDSALSTHSAITDNQGYAQTVLTAGQVPNGFQVEAKAYQAYTATWYLNIPNNGINSGTMINGTFALRNKFDVQTDFHGTNISEVLNILNDISDDPQDPGKFIVDLIIDASEDELGPLYPVANLARYILYTPVNDLLISIAPDLINGIKDIMADLSGLTRKFDISSSIISSKPQSTKEDMVVTHRLHSIIWNVNGQVNEFQFDNYGMNDPETQVHLAMTNNSQLTLGEHSFEMKFGAFLLAGLNTMIIPAVDPNAHNFAELVEGWVDCTQVAQTMANNINIIGLNQPSIWEPICELSINVLGQYLEGELVKMGDDTSSLMLNGKCTFTDNNGDMYYDSMNNGIWNGSFTLRDNTAALSGSGNTFIGSRTK